MYTWIHPWKHSNDLQFSTSRPFINFKKSFSSYPLVICYIAIENDHRNSYPAIKWWIFSSSFVCLPGRVCLSSPRNLAWSAWSAVTPGSKKRGGEQYHLRLMERRVAKASGTPTKIGSRSIKQWDFNRRFEWNWNGRHVYIYIYMYSNCMSTYIICIIYI